MTNKIGLLLVSHVDEIAQGVQKLLDQIASDVSIEIAGGTFEGDIGTSFDKITAALNHFDEQTILAIYDLGSAKMNLEMAAETSTKQIQILNVAFLEGAYVTASLLQAGVSLDEIKRQLEPLTLENK